MNEFINDIWRKAIKEDLEKSFAFMEAYTEKIEKKAEEEIQKRAEQLENELLEKPVKEIAEIIATIERKTQKQASLIEIQRERLNTLDEIKDIIVKEYGLED